MVGFAYPEISPVFFSIGPVVIRWYSMAYLFGILLGWWLVSGRVKKYSIALSSKNLEDVAFYITAGVIFGGRLGYVLFYNAIQYWQHPAEIFAVWHGGMSFHGGIVGVIIACWLISRKLNFPFLQLTDLISPAAPIGIFLGRLANFANDELWGRVTDVPWAVRFPNGGYLPRHPSQIYEGCLEGLVLFMVLNILWQFRGIRERRGILSAVFLLGYSLARVVVERFREPDAQIGFLWQNLTMGQVLSLPFFLVGVYLIGRHFRKA